VANQRHEQQERPFEAVSALSTPREMRLVLNTTAQRLGTGEPQGMALVRKMAPQRCLAALQLVQGNNKTKITTTKRNVAGARGLQCHRDRSAR